MSNSELERWLAGGDLVEEQIPGQEEWLADFDADRQVVCVKLGPYRKLYLRPQKFNKRFYHQLYPLSIETWRYRRQIEMFDGFCTLDVALELRFQATLAYAQRNSEILPSINQYIKQSYAELLDDIVNRELRKLDDGRWVYEGLASVERAIALAICELLAIQHIQSQASCHLAASFEEFPPLQPGRDQVYFQVLKKTFEINEQKNREINRQQRLVEQQALAEKQRRLEHLQELTEMESREQAMEAEKTRRLLEEQEDQLVLQLAIEKRIHTAKLEHQEYLKTLSLDSDLRFQEQQQAKQRLAEIRQLNDDLAHMAEIEDKKRLVESAQRNSNPPPAQQLGEGGGDA